MEPSLGEAPRYPLTHAWLPKEGFDEVVHRGNWYFARKDSAYVGLYSHQPAAFQTEGEEADKDLVAPGLMNVWICEMGRSQENGSFQRFVKDLSQTEVAFGNLSLSFTSPTQGKIQFSWEGAFKVKGREIPLYRDFRYSSLYGTSPRFSERIKVEAGGHGLVLNFKEHQRHEISSLQPSSLNAGR